MSIYDTLAHTRPPFYRAPGLGYLSTEVTLPLAPNRLLHISHYEAADGRYLPIPERSVDEVNRTTCGHSDRWLLCRSPETRDIWFEDRPLAADAWENTQQAKQPSTAE